jgi:hypothetical protein
MDGWVWVSLQLVDLHVVNTILAKTKSMFKGPPYLKYQGRVKIFLCHGGIYLQIRNSYSAPSSFGILLLPKVLIK